MLFCILWVTDASCNYRLTSDYNKAFLSWNVFSFSDRFLFSDIIRPVWYKQKTMLRLNFSRFSWPCLHALSCCIVIDWLDNYYKPLTNKVAGEYVYWLWKETTGEGMGFFFIQRSILKFWVILFSIRCLFPDQSWENVQNTQTGILRYFVYIFM